MHSNCATNGAIEPEQSKQQHRPATFHTPLWSDSDDFSNQEYEQGYLYL